MSKLEDAFQETPISDPVEHVRDAVHINGADLKRELERLPADLAHYGFKYAAAHRTWISAKMRLEEVQAESYLAVRETMTDLGQKVTEAILDAKVMEDEGVRDCRAAVIVAEFEREQLRAVVDALRAKRENLTSLVLLARAELAGSHGFRDIGSEKKSESW